MSTQPKPFVFVLMPFAESFDDVYRIGIKETCERVGAYCERVDEQHYEGRILDRIYNQIAKADIIVADMTDRNANVFYEVGYAHAMGKRNVILVTRHADDIPFDLKDFPHIVYGDRLTELRDMLEKRLNWCIANPSVNLVSVDVGLELWVQGKPLREKSFIQFDYQVPRYKTTSYALEVAAGPVITYSDQGIPVPIDVFNKLATVHAGRFSIGIVSDGSLVSRDRSETIRLENGRSLHLKRNEHPIFPECWAKFEFTLDETDKPKGKMKSYQFEARLYTDVGKHAWNFSAVVKWTE